VLRWIRILGVAFSLLLVCAPQLAAAARVVPGVTVRVTIHGHIGSIQTPGKITFVPDRVKAGVPVTFDITNTDFIGHNFLINGHQSRVMGPHGGRAVLRNVSFTRPGHYDASSPDDNHSGIGGVLVVAP
jgi:hypothetical protein